MCAVSAATTWKSKEETGSRLCWVAPAAAAAALCRFSCKLGRLVAFCYLLFPRYEGKCD